MVYEGLLREACSLRGFVFRVLAEGYGEDDVLLFGRRENVIMLK